MIPSQHTSQGRRKSPPPSSQQLSLFDFVADAYGQCPDEGIDNASLYQSIVRAANIPEDELERKAPIGKSGQQHSLLARRIRWYQQDLKRMGLIERVDGKRGLWNLTTEGKKQLRQAGEGVAMVAFSTELGVAIWASSDRVFSHHLDVPIVLAITSPPYPLRKPRAYGNPPASEYVDFICRMVEPIVANLAPGGSLCLNVSNDIFEPGSPARSTYMERLVIALEDRMGLKLMDRFVWDNPSKPPGPVAWASKERYHLNVGWEPVLWFTNDPFKVKSNNQRVLQPHSARHQKLIAAGGEQREAEYADGAYKIRKGSYGNPTAGRIPRNVLRYGHSCPDHRQYRKDAAQLGLPAHGAPFPKKMVRFLIEYLSEPGDLVVDNMGGKLTVAKAAEELGRRWMVTEWMWDYIRAAAERFRSAVGFELSKTFTGAA